MFAQGKGDPVTTVSLSGLAPSAGSSAADSGPTGRRVLLVDDHEDTVESLADLLRLHGHQVIGFRDGAAALAAASQWRPDVAILDLGMLAMDGFTLARRLRGEPWGKDIFLIALTGWAGEDYWRRSMEAGFDQFFVKPASLDALFAAIRRAV
jgi:CheY-like chemotaxis protein